MWTEPTSTDARLSTGDDRDLAAQVGRFGEGEMTVIDQAAHLVSVVVAVVGIKR